MREKSEDVKNTLASVPEWAEFEDQILEKSNRDNEGHLGGSDPRAPAESPFDNDDFNFGGFKPVPKFAFKFSKTRNDQKKDQDDDEDEDGEGEDKESSEEEDIEKYFEETPNRDEGEDEDDLERDDNDDLEDQFTKTASQGFFSDMFSNNANGSGRTKRTSIGKNHEDRYKTIDMDDDDEGEIEDVNERDLEWEIDPVDKKQDDEQILDDSTKDFALEIITRSSPPKPNRSSKLPREDLFDINVDQIKKPVVVKDVPDGENDFMGNNYWNNADMGYNIDNLLNSYI